MGFAGKKEERGGGGETPLAWQLTYSLNPRPQRYLFTGQSRGTLWQPEENSAVCSRMNGFRKVRRCGSGFTLTMKSCSARITGFSLAASSWSLGYSRTKSPWPMVLFTSTMLWHIMQLRPACAAGVFSIWRIGVSNIPLKRSAGSWQPAHHLEDFTPATSCIHSMLLRYH